MLTRPRAVLDANIYVSALLFGGKPLRVLRLAESGGFILLVSSPIQAEVEAVLAEKFRFSRPMIRKSCGPLWKLAERTQGTLRVDLCRDPDDNKILECAIAGDAHYIITGDRDLLDLPSVSQYAILTAGAFLKLMEATR